VCVDEHIYSKQLQSPQVVSGSSADVNCSPFTTSTKSDRVDDLPCNSADDNCAPFVTSPQSDRIADQPLTVDIETQPETTSDDQCDVVGTTLCQGSLDKQKELQLEIRRLKRQVRCLILLQGLVCLLGSLFSLLTL